MATCFDSTQTHINCTCDIVDAHNSICAAQGRHPPTKKKRYFLLTKEKSLEIPLIKEESLCTHCSFIIEDDEGENKKVNDMSSNASHDDRLCKR